MGALPPAPRLVAAATLTVNLMQDPGPGARVFATVGATVGRRSEAFYPVELGQLRRVTGKAGRELVTALLKAADAARGGR